MEERFISIVIPNRNGAASVGECLRAAFAVDYRRFEVVVVDDGSEDDSVEIIRRFPCKLVRLDAHAGVSKARNAGARESSGELLLFIDNDCLLEKEALSIANSAFGDPSERSNRAGPDLVLGGTYTPEPHDQDFFSAFQSIFINHFETKRRDHPDYVAAHLMAVDAKLFERSGGFVEDSFIGVAASVEDVELSHRLRRSGCRLVMNPDLRVKHMFRFSFRRSLGNAIKKARYWTMYSVANRNLLADSGTASLELKVNVLAGAMGALLLAGAAALRDVRPVYCAAALLAFNLWVNRRLVAAWSRIRGTRFSLLAILYYTTLYAGAVAIGGALGVLRYLWKVRFSPGYRSCEPRSGTFPLSS